MRIHSLCYILSACCILSLTSCNRNMFDPEVYDKVITESFPVGDIDGTHTWELTKGYTVNVTANIDTPKDIERVCILSGNPYRQKGVEIMAEDTIKKHGTDKLIFYAPTCQTTFFAAVVATDGQYFVKSFSAGQQNVAFDVIDLNENTGTLNSPIYQTFTYLFEDSYPKPEDWDFNDLVLRVQNLRPAHQDEIRLRVTLAAVGTLKHMAAAIRLLNYNYDEVESVSIEEGRTFDNGFGLNRVFIENADLLIRGRNNEAVLNLFEDAHYALSPRLNKKDNGSVNTVRCYYNTSRNPNGSTTVQIAPKSLTYVVKLKSVQRARAFTINNVEPFAMEDFNSGKWEIHASIHKPDQVLFDLGDNETALANNMVWALTIPSATFSYPIEKQSLGYYKNGVLTGAYMVDGHSYGQWVANRNSSIDWFLYPTRGLIY